LLSNKTIGNKSSATSHQQQVISNKSSATSHQKQINSNKMTAIVKTHCNLQHPQEDYDWEHSKEAEKKYIREAMLSMEQQARKKAVEKAREEGIKKGEKRGFEQGKRKGLKIAKREARKISIHAVKELFRQGCDISIIAFALELPSEEIKRILKEEVEVGEGDLSGLESD
jgi:flagellar biosynthesis/type III secretory pathway protein FliH